jgi:hypothetical protein
MFNGSLFIDSRACNSAAFSYLMTEPVNLNQQLLIFNGYVDEVIPDVAFNGNLGEIHIKVRLKYLFDCLSDQLLGL